MRSAFTTGRRRGPTSTPPTSWCSASATPGSSTEKSSGARSAPTSPRSTIGASLLLLPRRDRPQVDSAACAELDFLVGLPRPHVELMRHHARAGLELGE